MRLRYIDYAKGFAIILMIFAHTMSTINFLHIWIYSFHMPIFFIMSGILMNRRKIETLKEVCDITVHNMIKIGIPYFIFGGSLIIFYSLLNIMGREPLTFGNRFLRLITFQGIDSLWFLPVYVFAYILMVFLGYMNRYGKNIRFFCSLLFLLILICFSGSAVNDSVQLAFKAMIAVVFMETGIVLGEFNFVSKISKVWMLVIFIIGFIGAQFNGPVEMSVANMENPFLYFFCAVLTSLTVLAVFSRAEKMNCCRALDFMELFGKNSIVLLCTNNIFIEIIRLLDYKLFGNILIQWGMLGCVVFTIILLFIEYWMIKLADGPLAVLFGNFDTI